MNVSPNFLKGSNTKRLNNADYQSVSRKFELSTYLTRAVVHVEAGGAGFWNDGNMKMLYEGHIAWRETRNNPKLQKQLVDAGVAWKGWGAKKYGKAGVSRDRLRKALAIAGERAYRWASYGLPQTMGFNAKTIMGYKDAAALVSDFLTGERAQLSGLFKFIKGAGLLKALKAEDWRTFAKGYNGSSYAKHNYHGRLADAAAKFKGRKSVDAMADGVLREGESGEPIAQLQRDLNLIFGSDLETDGVYGRATKQSVHYAQGQLGLKQDGIAGKFTLKAIEKESAKKQAAKLAPKPPKQEQDGATGDSSVNTAPQSRGIIAVILELIMSLARRK